MYRSRVLYNCVVRVCAFALRIESGVWVRVCHCIVTRTCFWTKMAVWCVLQTCIWPRCRTRPCATKWAPRCTAACTRAAAPTASTGRPAVPRRPTRGTSSTTRTLTAGPDPRFHTKFVFSHLRVNVCAQWVLSANNDTRYLTVCALCDACDDFFTLCINTFCKSTDYV